MRDRIRRDIRIVCGHWSTLGRFSGLGVNAIDTGCVWGGCLSAVRFGAGWYGFNLDPEATKEMLQRLDAAFAKAGRARGKDFEIIITPPVSMPVDAMQGYAELGVHRLVVNLGSQRAERIDRRMAEIETLVKQAA